MGLEKEHEGNYGDGAGEMLDVDFPYNTRH